MNTRVELQSEPSTGQQDLYYANPTAGFHSCYKGCCCRCCCCFFSFLALLVLAALLVIVLAIKPKKPQLDLREVGLQYMAIGPGPATSNVYMIIRLALAVVNPNGVGMRCGESRISLMYRGTTLGRASVPGFWQHPHTVKEVVATVRVHDVCLSNADAADFTRDALLNDRVELRVLVRIATNISLLNIYSPPFRVSVNCVIVMSPRKQSLTYKQCGLEGLNV